jgi:hypothetical protein
MSTTRTTTNVVAMGYYLPNEMPQQTWNTGLSVSSGLILCLGFVYVMAVFHNMYDRGLRHQGWIQEPVHH